jgi:hypothetical protein
LSVRSYDIPLSDRITANPANWLADSMGLRGAARSARSVAGFLERRRSVAHSGGDRPRGDHPEMAASYGETVRLLGATTFGKPLIPRPAESVLRGRGLSRGFRTSRIFSAIRAFRVGSRRDAKAPEAPLETPAVRPPRSLGLTGRGGCHVRCRQGRVSNRSPFRVSDTFNRFCVTPRPVRTTCSRSCATCCA